MVSKELPIYIPFVSDQASKFLEDIDMGDEEIRKNCVTMCGHFHESVRHASKRFRRELGRSVHKMLKSTDNSTHFLLTQVKNELIALDFCFYFHFYFVGITT